MLARPRLFIAALFAAAPWLGLYVTVGWEVNAFKCGLMLSPLLAIHGLRSSRLGRVGRPLLLLVLYGCAASGWALVAKEVVVHDVLNVVVYEFRVLVQVFVFLLSAALPLLIVSAGRSVADIEKWMNAYLWSVFVLCGYGLVQTLSYLAFQNPITPIYRDGLFGTFSEFATVDILGLRFLRVHSFSREPKDLALVCVPALAWLFVRVSTPGLLQGRSRRIDVCQFVVIATCALLTFASSLLLMLPVLLVAVELIRPVFETTRRIRYGLRVAGVLALGIPLFAIVAQKRVIDRFHGPTQSLEMESFIQPSRERPALDFLLSTWPRSALGYGIGTQAFYLPNRMPAEFSKQVLDQRTAAGVDSLVIGTTADLGIPGLVLYTMIFLAALTTRRNEAEIVWPVRAALLAALLMGIPLNPAQHGGILWLLVGQACLLRALQRSTFGVQWQPASSLRESTPLVPAVPRLAPE
ncbi:MAG: hypothetical protein HY822_07155 [Acidobacteria bacterium]|nr:hypothetical protein [Acidobacteriota bacterium]